MQNAAGRERGWWEGGRERVKGEGERGRRGRKGGEGGERGREGEERESKRIYRSSKHPYHSPHPTPNCQRALPGKGWA